MNRYAKGRIKLKKGEQQRPNGTFAYRWTDRYGSRHAVYAKTIIELRIKEESILKDAIDGIKFLGPNVTINSYFEIWKKIKSGIRKTTLITYIRFYQRYIEPQFGHTTLKNLNYSNLVMFYKDLIPHFWVLQQLSTLRLDGRYAFVTPWGIHFGLSLCFNP